ncbi:MAG: ATP-dependent DNA helicase RecG [Atopobiaceae bacterium]|nr:ATP-dependent DNA helicase RecG [Atopobiaceae bacterium]
MIESKVSIASASERVAHTCSLVDSVSRLRFVNAHRAEALERLGILRVRDLLLNIPHRYLDFSHRVQIAFAQIGEDATITGSVTSVKTKRPRPKMVIVEVEIIDETGVLVATFFRQPWIAEQICVGDKVAFSGTVSFAYGYRQMKSPFYEVLCSAQSSAQVSSKKQDVSYDDVPSEEPTKAVVLPVHPATDGVSPAWMRRIISAALADMGDVCDWLPASFVAKHHLMSFSSALREVHFPHSLVSAEQARRRLAYDELLSLQLSLLSRRYLELQGYTPFTHSIDGPKIHSLREQLPFSLTDEQEVAIQQILSDMASPRIMNRLLLGDVGTGKTAVAALAVAAAADSFSQAAIMAPTSVLAQQYAQKIGPLLNLAGITWALIIGSTPEEERKLIESALADGSISVVFGTTALLSDRVVFKHLTLAVVDEQHRFGVDQRTALRKKGHGVDLLAMSATPIPRTLALSLYGDVDTSRIIKRPKAGAGVHTRLVVPENLDQAYAAIVEAVQAGHQAYLVCPLIDPSDSEDELEDVPERARTNARLYSATQIFNELSKSVFKDFSCELLTGRLSETQKDQIMEKFRANKTQILISTTVIEVGVDVPNTTVMVIFNADRFGLATLHQLRGRVGRGDFAGTVYLASNAKRGSIARKRLSALEQTSDGSKLAELDLKLRHEGETLGYKQSGGTTLKVSDLYADADLIDAAHSDALAIFDQDPTLSSELYASLGIEAKDRFGVYFEELGYK